MIINLDKTDITEGIASTIVSTISETEKTIRKIAFVGVPGYWRRSFRRVSGKGIAVTFLSDYEKAKEWLFA